MSHTNKTKSNHVIKLTAAEIANLWSNYLNDSLAVCTLDRFLAHIEDTQIELVLQNAYALSKAHLVKLTSIFKEENLTVPHGLTIEEDVNSSAPRLYTDNFYLFYIQNIGKLGMATYTLALSNSARLDICEYYTNCLHESIALFNKVTEVMLNKGAFIRAPYIPDDHKVEYVEKQSYLAGIFKEPRPLNVNEISNLYFNMIRNQLGRTLLTGFSQVAKSPKVREYMLRGRDMSDKHVEIFGSILSKEFLPSASSWDTLATESTIAPFSDKLMMLHVTLLNTAGIGNYGMAIGSSPRKDLGADFLRLMLEIVAYSEDGANIMISEGWLEQIPQAINRSKLLESKV